jgi:hypothetical protein
MLIEEIRVLPDNAITAIYNMITVFSQNQKEEKTLDEQIIEKIDSLNIPTYKVQFDENGEVIIDENTPPNFIDWVVNG